ncbi:proline-rich extensin-like protein EPR1 [Galendromus occidentalis]|uniref:Proline-rich extensin-like protein EPR1 n=1 Tax=Galendromus occidentalis TaxID=34638 RepID=A0AAJ6VWT2_9ACAR|nr:proline-rich extensin-like protein EPR1 [Galendromus occidentalis]
MLRNCRDCFMVQDGVVSRDEEPAPPRRVTIRRRKKPTPAPESFTERVNQGDAGAEVSPDVAVTPRPLQNAAVVTDTSLYPTLQGPVTQPPGNFMFMRIGGYGFDNGDVPKGIEPPKEMLPELVPAGVRVRTPSGVVVSVRGRPGLYGIHPTPAPDINHGPRKPAPKPEIVYLTQTRPITTRAPTISPAAPQVNRAPPTTFVQDVRRPSQVQEGASPPRPIPPTLRAPQGFIQSPPARPLPRGRDSQFASRPIVNPANEPQAIRNPPQIFVEQAPPRFRPVSVVVDGPPIFQVPPSGQFGQRLRPLTPQGPVQVVAESPRFAPQAPRRPQLTDRAQIPIAVTPNDIRRPTATPNSYVIQGQQPVSFVASRPNAIPELTRIVEPHLVVQEGGPRAQSPEVSIGPSISFTPKVIAQATPATEPIDIKEPSPIRITGADGLRPGTIVEQPLITSGPEVTYSPQAPGPRPLSAPPSPQSVPQVVLVHQSPVREFVNLQPAKLYDTPIPQSPQIVYGQPEPPSNVQIQRLVPVQPETIQQNVVPVRQRVVLPPPSAIPQNVGRYRTESPENDRGIIVGPGAPDGPRAPIVRTRLSVAPTPQRVPTTGPDTVTVPSSVPAITREKLQPVAPLVQKTVSVPPANGASSQDAPPEKPSGFSFMRLGGFGFDNGVIPERFNVAPAKEMLPELVPAGVRVRTPSGVVVSVRGRPGLYGIHPTPPPDSSFGPTRKPPRPEIVYLNQQTAPPKPVAVVTPAPVVSDVPVRYDVPVQQRPARVPANSINIVEQPRRFVQILESPPRVVTQVSRVEQPRRFVQILESPPRVVTQVSRVEPQPVRSPVSPYRVVQQVPRIVTVTQNRPATPTRSLETTLLTNRPQAPRAPPRVQPQVELQRINTLTPQSPPERKTSAPTGSGGYGNDLSDFEDFELPSDRTTGPASKTTRVSSEAISGDPRVAAETRTQIENPYGVNLSSNGSDGPVRVVIGNIDEGPYNFHHRHTHGNGFAFVKLGVPSYQKMEADAVAALEPAVSSQQTTREDLGGAPVKKSRKKSS